MCVPLRDVHAELLSLQAELDSLVSKMKATEIRVAQLEERRKCVAPLLRWAGGTALHTGATLTAMNGLLCRFDPLAAVVSDGKRQELEVLTRKVQTMRAEAAVKAWARVAALLSTSSQSAAKEYAGARTRCIDACS